MGRAENNITKQVRLAITQMGDRACFVRVQAGTFTIADRLIRGEGGEGTGGIMTYKEWPECYKHCDTCDNLRHRDDLILVTDGAIDPDEKMVCAQCASKQLSALRNEVRAWRECRLWTDDNGKWKWYSSADQRLTEETNKALGTQ